MTRIFKIMGLSDWALAAQTGVAPPADIDRRDGYIHLSTEEQVLETARLHFAGRDDLVAAAFNAEDFGDALKWEASRGGALFPHLYAELPSEKALGVFKLVHAEGGGFEFGNAVS